MRALHALHQPGLHCLIFEIRYKSELIKCVYLCTFLIAVAVASGNFQYDLSDCQYKKKIMTGITSLLKIKMARKYYF